MGYSISLELTRNSKLELVQVSLSTPLTRPCAIYVLWRKQQAGNIDMFKNKINKLIKLKNTNLFVELPILKYSILSL